MTEEEEEEEEAKGTLSMSYLLIRSLK